MSKCKSEIKPTWRDAAPSIKDSQRYHTRFRLLELEDNIELTDAIEIHFIELPKLKKEMVNHESPLDRWAMQNWGHSCAQVCPLSLRRMG